MLAHPPYARADIPETYRRHIVDYMRKEQPGTILVDTNARYLYYVLPGGKAVRYGVTVGERWPGPVSRPLAVAAEWPDWIPTAEIQARLGPYPKRIAGGRKIRSARGRSTFTRATRTPCTASTAPTSRNISAKPSRPAASA